MKPWVRGHNNHISSNPLYKYCIVPYTYASDNESFESYASSTSIPFFFDSMNSTIMGPLIIQWRITTLKNMQRTIYGWVDHKKRVVLCVTFVLTSNYIVNDVCVLFFKY